MQRDSAYIGNADIDRAETAKMMMESMGATGSDSVLGSDTRAVAAIGRVRDTFAGDLQKFNEDTKEDPIPPDNET